ncbi:MAG: alpha/beta fold hydrolase [Acidobacteriota bacterium]
MMLSTLLLLSLPLNFAAVFPTTNTAAAPAATPRIADTLPRRGALGIPFSPVTSDLNAANNLKPGEGLLALKPLPGLTAEKAGIQAGDILVALNDKPVGPSTISTALLEFRAGNELTFKVIRDGKPLVLKAALSEKPRDPGNSNYEVIYSQVLSNGNRIRTIITKPRKAGLHPALFFIQGFSPISYDYTLEGAKGDVSTIDGPLLFEFANSDFVTMRVEKPGVGDSEGGPFADLDYTTELDIYRQALAQLKSMPGVDPNRVFIFGHSMGGAFGPMIANESPVKGIAVYGTAARTWYEYLLDTIRYQGLVAGATFEDTDASVRQGSRLMALVFLENQSVEQVKQSHPELSALADAYFPGGLFSGKTLEFWRQLNQTNFASYWAKCNARVLAVRGSSDFVTYDADHKLIADIVNRANPGWGKFATAPNSDHLFHDFASEPESMKNFQHGTFNHSFTTMLKDWIAEVLATQS